MQDFKRLARQEKDALAQADQAQEGYRVTWWTMNLAFRSLNSRAEVSKAYDEVAPILGLSRSYLGTRRSLALAVDDSVIESGEVFKLPPRKAIAWMDAKAGPINAEAVARLLQFEEEGVSLRAMTAELMGGKPSWWRNAEEAKSAPASPEQVLAALDNPEVARKVLSNPKAARAIENTRQTLRDERLAKANLHPNRRDPELDTPIEVLEVIGNLETARAAVVRATRGLADVALTEEVRAFVGDALAKLLVVTEEMRHVVNGDADLDAALAHIMEGSE